MAFFLSQISLVQKLRKCLKWHFFSPFVHLVEVEERVPIAVAVSIRKDEGDTIKSLFIGHQLSTFAHDQLSLNLNEWPKTQKAFIKLLFRRLPITEGISSPSGCTLIFFTHNTTRCWLTAQFRQTEMVGKHIFQDNSWLTSKRSVLTEIKVGYFPTTVLVSPFTLPLLSIFLSYHLKVVSESVIALSALRLFGLAACMWLSFPLMFDPSLLALAKLFSLTHEVLNYYHHPQPHKIILSNT